MLTIILLASPVIAFIGFGIYCAIHNWKNHVHVGHER